MAISCILRRFAEKSWLKLLSSLDLPGFHLGAAQGTIGTAFSLDSLL
jgi:hypothetical protein